MRGGFLTKQYLSIYILMLQIHLTTACSFRGDISVFQKWSGLSARSVCRISLQNDNISKEKKVSSWSKNYQLSNAIIILIITFENLNVAIPLLSLLFGMHPMDSFFVPRRTVQPNILNELRARSIVLHRNWSARVCLQIPRRPTTKRGPSSSTVN